MSSQKKLIWYPKEFMGRKLLATGTMTFVLSLAAVFIVCSHTAIPVILIVLVPLTPVPAAFLLAFFDQRLGPHAVAGLLSAVVGLVPVWMVAEHVTLEAAAFVVLIFIPVMWAASMLASLVGLAVSRDCYVIRIGQPSDYPACGYDLTGNVSGRCPECGRAIDGRQRAKSGTNR